MARWRRVGTFLRRFSATAVVLTGLIVVGALWWTPPGGVAPVTALPAVGLPVGSTVDDLADAVGSAQRVVAETPDDWQTWAALGLTCVQLARASGRPSWYLRADESLQRSLQLQPEGRNTPALIGLSALALARRDVAEALRRGQQAVEIDAFSAPARAAVADALLDLGRYEEGFAAAQHVLDLRPGTASYVRASASARLRGDNAKAADLLTLALDVASTAAEIGFVRHRMAELSFGRGDLAAAESQADAGLDVVPRFHPLIVSKARVVAAKGDLPRAIALLRPVVEATTVPEYAWALGELLEAGGDPAGAKAQYDLAGLSTQLQTGAGVNVTGEFALLQAEHGDAAAAVTQARDGRTGRPTIAAEDALGWALHRVGDDEEALTHAEAALRLGTPDAEMHYHRGMIHAALGNEGAARRDLSDALRMNPYFSLRHVPVARATLMSLGTDT